MSRDKLSEKELIRGVKALGGVLMYFTGLIMFSIKVSPIGAVCLVLMLSGSGVVRKNSPAVKDTNLSWYGPWITLVVMTTIVYFIGVFA